MTEISNVKSGSQVVNLKSANARDPVGSGSIERFSSASAAKGEAGPAPATAQSLEVGQNPVDKATQAIEEFIGNKDSNTHLRIDKDDDTGRFVYKSVDSESGEVISQFPPETILQMISKFRDPEGLVVDDKA